MAIKIRIVTPVFTLPEAWIPNITKEVAFLEKFGFIFDNVFIKDGPSSIEGHFDEALSVPYTVAAIREAERDGIDACIINCMGDPGLMAAREVVSIPVAGPCEAAMHMAAVMGHKFAVVTVLESVRPLFDKNALLYGLASKLATVRVVDVPVLNIEDDETTLIKRIVEQSVAAIEQNQADVIILGCTGFLGVSEKVEAGLKEKGYLVPVINPVPVAAVMAGAMVMAGLRHSDRAYPSPNPEKAIQGFAMPAWTMKGIN